MGIMCTEYLAQLASDEEGRDYLFCLLDYAKELKDTQLLNYIKFGMLIATDIDVEYKTKIMTKVDEYIKTLSEEKKEIKTSRKETGEILY